MVSHVPRTHTFTPQESTLNNCPVYHVHLIETERDTKEDPVYSFQG